MNEMLIIGGLVALTWVGLLLLRVPSSIAFLSLLIGQLLSTEASSELYRFATNFIQVPQFRYVQLGLLVLPLIITLILMRNRVSRSKISIEFLPILFVSALAILLIAPLVPALQSVLDIASGDRLPAIKSIVVIAASVSGLLSAWLTYPKAIKASKHHS